MFEYATIQRVAVAVALLFVAGCAAKPTTTVPAMSGPVTAATNTIQSSIIPGSAKDFQVNVGDTIHFDYDRWNIRSEDRAILQKQAVWLSKYPSVRVGIEGHCDERGTRAYNLALGARRAQAAKDYLVSLGVDGSRISTISYGKERPLCGESTEACWSMNRRAITDISSGAAS